jgi:glycosyltransferase involved in cell wall biosynthesis
LERFRQLGYVCEDNLPGLYTGAEVFVLPSLDEGFGLPILEAMACGTTVIVARAGAMPEVADKAALLFNPTQVDEFAEVLVQCLNDPAMRCLMAEKGLARAREFSWDDSARKLWEVLQQCQ